MFAQNSDVEAKYAARLNNKTVEQIYQKVTQKEHILLRPDSYVGSIEPTTEECWIYDDVQECMIRKKCSYVPALLKIYDEILVNAADNLIRDPTMNKIDIHIDEAEGWVSVYNNGRGIPVRKHATHDMYVCELIFGNLLTGDNYNDNQTRCTGGRNGYGAKLTNVYSTKFIVETGDKDTKKRYRQVFEQNMNVTHPPEIVAYDGESFTKVIFYADFPRFKLTKLDSDHCALFRRRAYDVAGTTREGCKVSLNGQTIAISNFMDYITLYVGKEPVHTVVHEKVNDRWEVALSLSTTGAFTQVSFVNSISTHKGGNHVHHVMDPVIEVLMERISKEYKGGIKITKGHIKNHLAVYINCLIENPHFDTQTKETHTTRISSFGSKCVLSDESIAKIADSGVIDLILSWAKSKEKADMARLLKIGTRSQSKIFGLPKLEDAHCAGTKNSLACTLILTEGDSAKSLAVAGLSVIGRENYGVYPLRGKMLNVRTANFKTCTNNAEVSAILKIIGLQYGKKYADNEDMLKDLRYGSVMIMSDQDFDGSHIKGLIINFFAHWFPFLFKREGFVREFVTPIVKVKKRKKTKCFFTMPDYERWKDANNNGKGWSTKYYKGLGTSTQAEAKDYFKMLDLHSLNFKWESEQDDEKIDLAFNLKRAGDRKGWIDAYDDEDMIDHNESEVTYTDFVNKELVQFAKYDVFRSVPSLVDGLKPGQRKVLFAAIKRNLVKEIKVAQFASNISEVAAYHHGEASLEATIITMAHDFIGTNNVKLLMPNGQFGTRLLGGKDHASSRYIYTSLNMPLARAIFHPADDKLLDYQNEEGQWIEPKMYIPVIPLALCNGCEGIGTGYSTLIPPFNPRDIIENCRRIIRGEQMAFMVPWFRNFTGEVTKKSHGYQTEGNIRKVGPTTLEITELPIRKWTTNYKEFLEGLLPGANCTNTAMGLLDFQDLSTDTIVHFVVEVSANGMTYCESMGLENAFKLSSSIPMSNMMLFDANSKVKLYRNVLKIMEEFAEIRMEFYRKRKAYVIGELMQAEKKISNQTRFILMVISKEIIVRKRKIQALLQELKGKDFDTWSAICALGQQTSEAVKAGREADDEGEGEGEEEQEEEQEGMIPVKDYAYLIDMPLSTLTKERVDELKKNLAAKTAERETMELRTLESLWEEDLVNLEQALDKEDQYYEDKRLKANEDRKQPPAPMKKKLKPGAAMTPAGNKKKRAISAALKANKKAKLEPEERKNPRRENETSANKKIKVDGDLEFAKENKKNKDVEKKKRTKPSSAMEIDQTEASVHGRGDSVKEEASASKMEGDALSKGKKVTKAMIRRGKKEATEKNEEKDVSMEKKEGMVEGGDKKEEKPIGEEEKDTTEENKAPRERKKRVLPMKKAKASASKGKKVRGKGKKSTEKNEEKKDVSMEKEGEGEASGDKKEEKSIEEEEDITEENRAPTKATRGREKKVIASETRVRRTKVSSTETRVRRTKVSSTESRGKNEKVLVTSENRGKSSVPSPEKLASVPRGNLEKVSVRIRGKTAVASLAPQDKTDITPTPVTQRILDPATKELIQDAIECEVPTT